MNRLHRTFDFVFPTGPVTLALGFLVLVAAATPRVEAQVPTPASVLGHEVGADFELSDWDETLGYFRRLAASSNHMELVDIGYTAEGRPWTIALISSPTNLGNLDRIREISLRLAHPSGLTDEEARALAREGKAVVHIDGGLHSTEVANAQHTLQLAYDLLVGAGTPAIDAMLDEVVLMLWPTLNPDGLQMVADWYAGNVGSPYEVAPLPALYQKYVGHDNNRDAYMLNTVESRVVNRVWRAWEPQIIHVHHQSSPFPTRIWLPPFAEPVSPRAPPLAARTVNMIGMAMAHALEENGQPGATHMDFFDAWYPGYVDYMPIFQNIAAYWTETALYRYATPHFYTIADFPEYRRDLRPETLYNSPWKGGWWRIGDAVDYMVTSSKAVLDYAARYRESLLYNRYQSGRDQIAKYTAEPPYAYLVPAEQPDPVAVVEMLRRLAASGLPVQRLTEPITYQGVEFAAGTWVVPMQHEFAELARELLEVQHYPDLREFPEGPPSQPYDVAGWTLGYLMGVRVIEGRMPLPDDLEAALESVSAEAVDWRAATGALTAEGRTLAIDRFGDAGARPDVTSWDSPVDHGFDDHAVAAAIEPPDGRVRGSGGALRLDPAQNNTYRALNEAFELGAQVRFDGDSGDARWVIGGLGGDDRTRLVRELALQAEAGATAGTAVRRPRVGLYRPWRVSMDEGWTRWVLERFRFRFESLRNAEIHAGDLRSRYDVIILPAESPAALREGHATGSVPARYAGGLGEVGLRALDAFVRAGGRLIAFNQSSNLLIDAFALPVTDVVREVNREGFFSAGSILEVRPEDGEPLMAGLGDRAPVFFDRGPVFEVPEEDFSGAVLARYAPHGSPLLSGYLLGEEHTHGRAAAVRVNRGAGSVILLGFRPQWRGQTFGTFKVLFNAILTP